MACPALTMRNWHVTLTPVTKPIPLFGAHMLHAIPNYMLFYTRPNRWNWTCTAVDAVLITLAIPYTLLIPRFPWYLATKSFSIPTTFHVAWIP